jgi:hypothetical protein
MVVHCMRYITGQLSAVVMIATCPQMLPITCVFKHVAAAGGAMQVVVFAFVTADLTRGFTADFTSWEAIISRHSIVCCVNVHEGCCHPFSPDNLQVWCFYCDTHVVAG